VVLIGFTLFGVGNGLLATVQETLLVQFCHPRHLAFMIGMLIAVGKITSFLGTGLSLNIRDLSEQGTAGVFWVSTLMCLVSLCANIVFVVASRPRQRKQSKRHIHAASLNILTPSVAWFLVLAFLLGFLWTPFITLSSNMFAVIYDLEDKDAAYLASIVFAIPIGANPAFGYLLGRIDKRTWFIVASVMAQLVAFLLLSFPDQSNPIQVVLLTSVSITLGPLCMVSCAPRLLRSSRNHIGLLLGLYKSLEMSGAVIMASVAGVLQDADDANSASDDDDDDSSSYALVIQMFLVACSFTLVAVWGFWYTARARVDHKPAPVVEDEWPQKQASTTQLVGALLFASVIVLSWVIFSTVAFSED
jgi:MFS family permease